MYLKVVCKQLSQAYYQIILRQAIIIFQVNSEKVFVSVDVTSFF